MTIFWTMFWLGFLGIPLILLLGTLFMDSGSAASNTHIWVYKGSNRKVKDATVEEVWKRQNPGKSWDKHQSNIYITVTIILCVGFLFLLAKLAGSIFALPTDRPGLRLFWQIGAPILGALTAAIFYGLQTLIENYKSGFLKALHILALVLTAVGVIGALVLTFLKRPLPISQHWIWAPVGATAFFLLVDQILGGAKKERASKGGGNLEGWAYEVKYMVASGMDIKDFRAIMEFAIYQLKAGELDWKIQNDKFFKQTEDILLDLVRGKSMSISDDKIYSASSEVTKAVQAFYFYSVENFTGYDMHPRIRKAVTKK
ncbi:hypothetical protein JR338_10570 [Chloroflexota bacterium]|nr:hypothetical protein JR338_10570 [Chloroflexota bacterium]